ncbi:transcriptional regulator TbsP [Haloferacaceae archaeon DSL9]
MESNLLETNLNEILETTLGDTTGELLAVDPSEATIEALVEVAPTVDDLPQIRMLAHEHLLKEVMDDFLVASNAAELIDSGVLTIRTLSDDADNSLLVSEDGVFALVSAGDHVAALSSTDEAFVEQVFETYDAVWEDASPYKLRTPPISRVRQTLDSDIGEPTRQDFETVLASLETARGDGDGLDEVTISLLVAAKNDILLYDISKWGEDVGIASKATFSRTKTRLEDMGLIATEKVPIDVGRPRLRLKLGDDRLRSADANQIASVAQSILH